MREKKQKLRKSYCLHLFMSTKALVFHCSTGETRTFPQHSTQSRSFSTAANCVKYITG